jgi:hypothetical protein
VKESAVVEQIQKSGELSAPLREEAIARARRFRQDPQILNEKSWSVVRKPDATESAYRTALLQAQEACRLAPDTGELLNTRGVAEYRNGQWEAALKSLTESDRLQSARFKGSHPIDLAFLAMTHFRLGNKTQTAEYLGRMREALKLSRWAKDVEARELAKEAEALVGTSVEEKK